MRNQGQIVQHRSALLNINTRLSTKHVPSKVDHAKASSSSNISESRRNEWSTIGEAEEVCRCDRRTCDDADRRQEVGAWPDCLDLSTGSSLMEAPLGVDLTMSNIDLKREHGLCSKSVGVLNSTAWGKKINIFYYRPAA